MAHKLLPKFPGLAVAALLACSFLAAAEHRGRVTFGGLPLPGASVIASQGDRRLVTVTDPQGCYSFPDLGGGSWKVRVEMQCFVPEERDVAAAPDAPAAEWEMSLLPPDRLMAAAPPAAPVVPPAPGAPPGPGGTVPEAAKNPSGFQRAEATASAGAGKAASENEALPPAEEMSQLSTEGFLVNGSVNNAASTPFALGAAFGNNRRGPRSLYSGNLGFTLGSSSFDARPFSLTGQRMPKPDYRRSQGMASFGGPLKIPGLLRRGGPTVIVNYQWVRVRNAVTSTALVPTPAERAGDLSKTADALGRPASPFDPSSRLPFPGGVIPESRIRPEARALLALYPLPNFTAGARYNYQVPLSGSTHQDSLQARVNKTIRSKNQINGAFGFQSTRSDSTNLFGFLDTGANLGFNASISWMHRFTQRSFLTIGGQFSRSRVRATPFFSGRRNVSAEAGIVGNSRDPEDWGPPDLLFSSGIAGLSLADRSLTRNQTSGISVTFFQARGSHNFTAGAEYRRQQFNQLAQQNPRGAFTFTGAAAGHDLAGFLLGLPDTAAIAFGNADKYFRAPATSVYVNDDWRFRPSLTINAGLRWDYAAPLTELYGRLVNLDVAPGFGAVAPVAAASPTGPLTGRRYPASLMDPDRRALQPRVGVSWRPLPASSLVVRAGYGIYHDTSVYPAIVARMAQQPPLSKTFSLQNSASRPLTLADGFNAPAGAVPNTFGVDPDFRIGFSQSWQLSVQRDLPGSFVTIATYLGNKGSRAARQVLPNTYPAGAPNPCPACPSGFLYLTSGGTSSRHAGRFEVRRRLHSGVAGQLSYTFAKAIDDAAPGGKGQPPLTAQDWLDPAAERALSSFDQRHLLNAQLQYTTGMGLRGGTLAGGWKGGLFKDWTIAAQIAKGSGRPLTPLYPAAVRGTGVIGPLRPDFTGAPIYDAPAGLFLNPAAVAPPAPGRWGNAGRNSITGPGQFVLNASLSRAFRMGDRAGGEFRLEALNALNHPAFTAWNTIMNGAQFGLPVSAYPMRTVHTSFRVRF